jgi:modulator of FtsH protease HflK
MIRALSTNSHAATVFQKIDPYNGGMDMINERLKRAVTLLTDGGGPWGKRGGGASGGSGGGSGSGGGDDGSGGGTGGGGPRNPWNLPPSGGGGRKPKGPNSALDALTKQMKSFGGGQFPDGNQGRLIRNIFLGFVILWVLFTCFHRIGPQEEGVIMRFGKYAGKLYPGIGFTLPAPIDRVTKVDVQAIDTLDIPEGAGQNLILTGDQNIIDLAYSVRWDIKDSQNFLFQLAEPKETIREVAESAMREVLSTFSLNDAMGPSRGLIEQRVAARMQILLNDYKAGVSVRGVAIKQADPPEAVNEAFKAVTVAQQNRQANINNANAYAQQTISRAQGEAGAFDKVFEQYRLAPEVTRRRMYYDTMEDILSRTDKTIVEPNAIAPYLPLGRNKPQVSVEEGGK